jgi:4-hydroxy-4-methyl-2-oxoglutarate aldolase
MRQFSNDESEFGFSNPRLLWSRCILIDFRSYPAKGVTMRHNSGSFALSHAVWVCLLSLTASTGLLSQDRHVLAQKEIIDEFKKASTGNVADAVDEATGHRGFMSHDMKPIFRAKIIGPAATAVLRPVLKNDARDYPNYALQILDEAAPGSVLVYVLEDGLETAGIGNLMSTTAKVRGLAGAVIDGGARDIDEIEEIGFPVFSRSVTPATSVGRYVSVAKQVPVTCAGVLVRPGDWIVGDWTGVVVVPADKIPQVVDLLRKYDEKESKMIPIIKETKSMLKALEKYNRY